MKKALYLLLILLSLFMISCSSEKEEEIKGKLTIQEDTINIEKNSEFNLSTILSFENGTIEYSCESDKVLITENTLKVIENGEYTLNICLKDENSKKIEKSIKVIVYSKTKTLNVECPEEMYLDETVDFKVSYDENCLIEISTEIIDKKIIKLENNKIIGLKAGSTKIIVEEKISGLKKEVNIEVIDNNVKTEEIQKILDQFVASLPVDTYQNLPSVISDHQEMKIEYVCESESLASNGFITRNQYDETVNGKVKLTSGDIVLEKEFEVIIWGTFTDEMAEMFKQQFPKEVKASLDLNIQYDNYGGTRIIPESSNPDILSKSGFYNRPFHDDVVTITFKVVTKKPYAKREYSFDVKIKGEDISYKTAIVKEKILLEYPANTIFYVGDLLPVQLEDQEATIQWLTEDGKDLSLDSLAEDPIFCMGSTFVARITIRGESHDETILYRVWNKKYNNDWEKVEDFVDALFLDEVRAFKYKLIGYQTVNNGYLPFYVTEAANVNKEYLLEYTYGKVRTNIKKASTEYVVVHDTAGTSPTHTPLSFAQNQVSANNNANNDYISWHFTAGTTYDPNNVTDEKAIIYQSLPLDEVAYHAGDGSHVYGDKYFNNTYQAWSIGGGNRNGIGIESCINYGSDYNITMRGLAKLIAELMIDFSLNPSRIKQHNHFSGKDCPGIIRHTDRWGEFIQLCQYEYFGKTELADAKFEWTSLDPKVMDNTGKILVNNGNEFVVRYSLKVTLNGESKEYTNSTKIQAMPEGIIG